MMDYDNLLTRVLIARRLSKGTIQIYKTHLKQYLGFCYSNGIYPEDMPHEALVEFMGLPGSNSLVGQRRALLVNLYEFVLKQGFKTYGLPYAKKYIRLPESLTPKQVSDILNSVKNDKQRLILKIMYVLGLRVSEVVKIKIEDFRERVDFMKDEKFVEIKVIGKGNKERRIAVPEQTISEIKRYLSDSKIKTGYLFPGQFKAHYNTTSITKIFNRAKIACGIKTIGSTHLLRKSRTTHLINGNISDRNIMLMMGWNSSKTLAHYHKANTFMLKESIDEIDVLMLNSIHTERQLKSA